MFDRDAALALLQFGDSAYPAGGFAFSWGVEGLAADGFLNSHADVGDLVVQHLTLRWNTMDRVLFCRAFACDGLDEICEVDRYADITTASAEMRAGSRRAGRALLGTAARLQGPLSTGYRGLIADDRRLGHLSVVQAIVYRDAGIDTEAGQLLSGWTLVVSLVSAAIRLGAIGHVEGQQSLATARKLLVRLLSEPVTAGEPSSFVPLIDIAVSRGPSRHVRMFTT